MYYIKEIMEGVGLLKLIVSTIKESIDILPSAKKGQVSQSLEELSTKLQLAELQIAKGLGYELCKCTWPPQIMVFTGKAKYGDKFRCPVCGQEISPDDDDIPTSDNWRIV